MPFGDLDKIVYELDEVRAVAMLMQSYPAHLKTDSGFVYELDEVRAVAMLTAGGTILIMLLLIFLLYYRMMKTQMRELEEAKREAVHANAAKSELMSI